MQVYRKRTKWSVPEERRLVDLHDELGQVAYTSAWLQLSEGLLLCRNDWVRILQADEDHPDGRLLENRTNVRAGQGLMWCSCSHP
jgi:hypothetical protein